MRFRYSSYTCAKIEYDLIDQSVYLWLLFLPPKNMHIQKNDLTNVTIPSGFSSDNLLYDIFTLHIARAVVSSRKASWSFVLGPKSRYVLFQTCDITRSRFVKSIYMLPSLLSLVMFVTVLTAMLGFLSFHAPSSHFLDLWYTLDVFLIKFWPCTSSVYDWKVVCLGGHSCNESQHSFI